MKTLIGILVLGFSSVLLFGQPRWLRTGPQTLEEVNIKREKLFSQLESLKGHHEQDAFSHAIFTEIAELEKQKIRLMNKLKH